MNIPNKIDICPIADSVVELRFSSNIYPNAVFGLIYNSLKDKFPVVEKLPILQLPEQLREADPNFKFKAHYRIISNEGYFVQIGPDVIVIGSPMPYKGWEEFLKIIDYVIGEIFKLEVVENVNRLGLRFINFFENNIFEFVNLKIDINNERLIPKNTAIRTEIDKNGYTNTLQVANNANQIINKVQKIGSVIDIDTFKDYDKIDFDKIFIKEIALAHETEKEIFFNLLKPEFLESLKPTYS